jgi:hypothetical protein
MPDDPASCDISGWSGARPGEHKREPDEVKGLPVSRLVAQRREEENPDCEASVSAQPFHVVWLLRQAALVRCR